MKWFIPALLVLFPCFSLAQGAELILRFGQGGMQERRAPDDSLGGGQLSLHLLLEERALSFSIASEYYTKGPDPEEPYEIESVVTTNAYHVRPLDAGIVRNLFLGGGIGRLSIPHGGTGTAFQVSAIVDTKAAWRISGFVEAKYLFCDHGNIDVHGFAVQVGIGFRLASW